MSSKFDEIMLRGISHSPFYKTDEYGDEQFIPKDGFVVLYTEADDETELVEQVYLHGQNVCIITMRSVYGAVGEYQVKLNELTPNHFRVFKEV